MTHKLFTLFLLTFITTMMNHPAQAAIRPHYQDIKLPTQQMVEKQTVTAPSAASTTNVVSGNAGPTSAAAVTLTSGITNPDVPRNIVITPGGTTADVRGCLITVVGTDFFDASLTETFWFTNAQTAAVTGVLAFKTVTSVAWAAGCEGGSFAATWSIGAGSKLGLKRCINGSVDYIQGGLANVFESTRATVVKTGTSIAGNTAQLNSSLNGSDVQLFFMQNYTCFP